MSIANHFNKLPKDAPLPISWKPSAELPTKRTERSWMTKKTSESLLTVHSVLSLITATANRSCLFPGFPTIVAFFPAWGIHILWHTWYPRMTPDTEKNVELLLWFVPFPSLTTNDVSATSGMCLSFIHQWSGNDDHPLLEPAIPCDATIGNEFPESDASLEITHLKCCILTQK